MYALILLMTATLIIQARAIRNLAAEPASLSPRRRSGDGLRDAAASSSRTE